jgi:CubicO group peptidase (beta-lactamase class C family)
MKMLPLILLCAGILLPPIATEAGQAAVCDGSRADAAALCRLIDAEDAAATRLHGVLVMRGETVIAERYFSGRDRIVGSLLSHGATFGPQSLHDTRSMSKSIVGLLVGAALADGAIPSLDTPALDLLPAYARFATPEKRRITVRHLLTMS